MPARTVRGADAHLRLPVESRRHRPLQRAARRPPGGLDRLSRAPQRESGRLLPQPRGWPGGGRHRGPPACAQSAALHGDERLQACRCGTCPAPRRVLWKDRHVHDGNDAARGARRRHRAERPHVGAGAGVREHRTRHGHRNRERQRNAPHAHGLQGRRALGVAREPHESGMPEHQHADQPDDAQLDGELRMPVPRRSTDLQRTVLRGLG